MKTRRSAKSYVHALLKALGPTVIAFSAIPSSLAGQPFNLSTDVKSPLWWTLDESVTPDQLRNEYRSTEALKRRLDDAKDRSQLPAVLHNEDRVNFYLSPQRNPDLVPLWMAFTAFTHSHLKIDGEQHVIGVMSEFGLNEQVASQICELARDFDREGTALFQENSAKQLTFLELESDLAKRSHKDVRSVRIVTRELLKKDANRALAKELGLSAEAAEDLSTAMKTDPWAQMSERYLPLLRDELLPSDWTAFRRFLLETVAAQMGDMIDLAEIPK